MSVVVTVLLIAGLLAAGAWTVLVAMAGAVEILPASAVSARAADAAQPSRAPATGVAVRPEAR
jgi:hypothetical protein